MNLFQIDPMLAIPALGASNILSVNKFGVNPDVDTASNPEDLWESGGLYQYPTTETLLEISSDSANDTNNGTGARSIKIFGLDSDWNLYDEIVEMNGAATIEATASFIRVYEATVLQAGSIGSNDGTITIKHKTDDTIAAIITPGKGRALMALFSIPRGYSGFITNMFATLNSSLNNVAGSRADIRLYVRPGADGAAPSWQERHEESIVFRGTSLLINSWSPYLKIPEKTDVRLSVAAVSNNNTDIDGGFDIILVNDKWINSQRINYQIERII